MPKYISLMSDFGFKRIFANPEHPHILISFIESVIPTLSISSIQIQDTIEQNDFPTDRGSIFDAHCVLNDGTQVIVEMQQIKQEYFVDRTILYASHVVRRQSVKEVWNYKLPMVYVISVMDFRLDPTDRHPTHLVTLRSAQNLNQLFYAKLQFIYIQLPNIAKLDDLTPLKTWLQVIRNLHKNEDTMTINTDSKTKKAITDAMTLAEFEQLTPAQKFRYDCEQMRETEEYSKIWTAHNDGLKQGIEKGREEGKQEGIEQGIEQGEYQAKINTARKLLQREMDLADIADITGLSETEISQITTETNNQE